MSTDIVVWGARATLTIPVVQMPATFDAHHAGRATHTALTITTPELRALAAAATAAIERIDREHATKIGETA